MKELAHVIEITNKTLADDMFFNSLSLLMYDDIAQNHVHSFTFKLHDNINYGCETLPSVSKITYTFMDGIIQHTVTLARAKSQTYSSKDISLKLWLPYRLFSKL